MLKIPSLITKVETTSDGGLRLRLETQELTGEDKALVMDYHNKFGFFFFTGETEKINEKDLLVEKLEFPNQKTQSQRLRGVIFKLWEQNHAGFDNFEMYYKAKTDKIIDWLKEKLD